MKIKNINTSNELGELLICKESPYMTDVSLTFTDKKINLVKAHNRLLDYANELKKIYPEAKLILAISADARIHGHLVISVEKEKIEKIKWPNGMLTAVAIDKTDDLMCLAEYIMKNTISLTQVIS